MYVYFLILTYFEEIMRYSYTVYVILLVVTYETYRRLPSVYQVDKETCRCDFKNVNIPR